MRPSAESAWMPLELAALPRAAAAPSASAGGPGIWEPAALDGDAARESEGATGAAFEAGLARGRDEGERAASAELAPALAALRGVIHQLESERETFARQRQRNLHALAMAAAQRLVEDVRTAAPERLSALVERAVALLGAGDRVVVRLHPDDLGHVQPLVAVEPPGALEWRADAGLSRGSFVVEGPELLVDGRADAALRALYERLGD